MAGAVEELNEFYLIKFGEFPGSPVVRPRRVHCQAWVGSLVGELRSHKPHGAAKKIKFN